MLATRELETCSDHLPDSNQIRGIFSDNNVVGIAVSGKR
jgi:hypothetical protein